MSSDTMFLVDGFLLAIFGAIFLTAVKGWPWQRNAGGKA